MTTSTITPYSPVGDSGFQAQQQYHNPQVDPEEFYRSTPESQTTHNHHENSATSPISPADSQAPIVFGVGQAQDYPPPPSQSTTTTQQQLPSRMADTTSYPSPVAEEGSSTTTTYPPPPIQPISVDMYRTSMGVVNGEVGAYPAPPIPQSPRRRDPYAGMAVPMTPLTPALKTPTFREEADVERYSTKVQKYDKRDLAVKLKVRLAKIFLRSINCACSLVVLSLVASTFAIFNATKHMAPRNNLPPWAVATPQWPQIVVLCIAVVSLCISLYIMYGYWRGGHKRAEKVAVYWTVFAVGTFIFTIVMWAIAAGIMQGSRNSAEGKDLWGWACKDNVRRKLFEEDINYKLVCREQDWVLVCAIIEISVETITIAVYAFAFYRLASKRKLRKSMDVRDKARSELWLAKLREQQQAEAEAGEPKNACDETDANTAYNKLNDTTVDPYSNLSDAEEGRAAPMPAPIVLQRPPKGNYATAPHKARRVSISPPNSSGDKVPPTPRSVSFQAPLSASYPPPPMSATFPARVPSSGSQK
ncbi:uncharacterized protein LAJ45_10384 [Morchella importuna]|uniref:uncharacterized protein n=1 Tax=Morchella importuna TaxID=1174673 RepID=UPI001E8E2E33|nr:uncharacterized protein LAJ45_10384 [Morchella importuna]KAH8145584.1 hypothetical protein LAJ45_10384 [Morchella importuna]